MSSDTNIGLNLRGKGAVKILRDDGVYVDANTITCSSTAETLTNKKLSTPVISSDSLTNSSANYVTDVNGFNTYTITATGASMSSINIGGNVSDTFGHHSVKAKSLRAARFTEDNEKSIAAYLVRKGLDVEWVDDGGLIVEGGGYRLVIDYEDWVVEDYDYDAGVAFFRVATLSERVKYDLR